MSNAVAGLDREEVSNGYDAPRCDHYYSLLRSRGELASRDSGPERQERHLVATSAQVVYGRLAAPSCDRYAARFDFVSLGSGAGSETGAGLNRPSTVR